jgi:hypothetical protein
LPAPTFVSLWYEKLSLVPNDGDVENELSPRTVRPKLSPRALHKGNTTELAPYPLGDVLLRQVTSVVGPD